MHRKYTSKLAICLVLFICLFATQALAEQVVLTNKTRKKIYVALCYRESASNDWVVRGWFSVNPRSKNTISIDTNNSIIYVHGNSGKLNWGCGNKSTSRTYAVISGKFLYKKDTQRPRGDGYRSVSFCMTKLTNRGNFAFAFGE